MYASLFGLSAPGAQHPVYGFFCGCPMNIKPSECLQQRTIFAYESKSNVCKNAWEDFLRTSCVDPINIVGILFCTCAKTPVLDIMRTPCAQLKLNIGLFLPMYAINS